MKNFFIKTSYVKIDEKYINFLKSKNVLNILNFGSGDGFASNKLRKAGFIVTDIDVLNLSKTNYQPILFDGKKIPFDNGKFDCVICNFVLHHIDKNLLNNIIIELKRVSKNYIIITEDLNNTIIDHFFTSLHLLLTTNFNSSNNLKMNSYNEWIKIFKLNNLDILYEIFLPRNSVYLYPVKRCIFILNKH